MAYLEDANGNIFYEPPDPPYAVITFEGNEYIVIGPGPVPRLDCDDGSDEWYVAGFTAGPCYRADATPDDNNGWVESYEAVWELPPDAHRYTDEMEAWHNMDSLIDINNPTDVGTDGGYYNVYSEDYNPTAPRVEFYYRGCPEDGKRTL